MNYYYFLLNKIFFLNDDLINYEITVLFFHWVFLLCLKKYYFFFFYLYTKNCFFHIFFFWYDLFHFPFSFMIVLRHKTGFNLFNKIYYQIYNIIIRRFTINVSFFNFWLFSFNKIISKYLLSEYISLFFNLTENLLGRFLFNYRLFFNILDKEQISIEYFLFYFFFGSVIFLDIM